MTLPAFAAERRAAGRRLLSIDISCAQQQTRCTPLLLSIDGTDRRTDTVHRPRPDPTPRIGLPPGRPLSRIFFTFGWLDKFFG